MQQEKKLEILKKHYREYFKDSFPAERLEKVVNQALCIKEETEAIFNAMEEYAAAQHSGTPGWVKASDRLPGWGKYVKWRHESGKELPGRESVHSMTDRDPASLHGWEWYDESESPSKEGNKEREDWISVNDRLPELETKVIVLRPNEYSKKNDVLMAYLHDSGEVGRSHGRLGESKWLYGHYWSLPAIVEFKTITHWLPLPVAPQYNQQKEGMNG